MMHQDCGKLKTLKFCMFLKLIKNGRNSMMHWEYSKLSGCSKQHYSKHQDSNFILINQLFLNIDEVLGSSRFL